MHLISAYEQGYISLEYFKQNFLDWANESCECRYGERCVNFYAEVALGKSDCCYYVRKYGVGIDGDIERESIKNQDNQIPDERDPFGEI